MRVSPSISELVFDRHRARDRATGVVIADPALDALASAMKAARCIAEQIGAASVSIMADVTVTPEANAVKLKKTALTLAERATKALDEARSRTLAEITKIEKAMIVEAPREAAEIRQVLRGMTREQRSIALSDDLFATAALASHALLSGLEKTEHGMLLSRFQRERYPQQVNRRERLGKALEDLDRGGNALVHFVTGLTDKPQIRQAEAAAERANQAVASAK